MAMSQALEHFLFSPEVAFGTFLAPAKALPVESFGLASTRETVSPDMTGGYYRGQGEAWQGFKPVAGKLVLLARPEYLGSLLKALFTAVTSTQQGATTAYRHKLTLDDTVPTGSFSAEGQYGSDAHFSRGVKITQLAIGCAAKSPVKISLGLQAQDEVWAGKSWDHDGVAGPATKTTPVVYPTTLHNPFRFNIGEVYQGGTVALTDGELVVTGGAQLACVEAFELTIDVPQDPFVGLNNSPCLTHLRDQGRKVTLKMDLDWIAADDDFVDAFFLGTETVMQFRFVDAVIAAPYAREMYLTLPRLVPISPTTPPDVAGAKARRKQVVTYQGLMHATVLKDVGLVIQNEETTL